MNLDNLLVADLATLVRFLTWCLGAIVCLGLVTCCSTAMKSLDFRNLKRHWVIVGAHSRCTHCGREVERGAVLCPACSWVLGLSESEQDQSFEFLESEIRQR